MKDKDIDRYTEEALKGPCHHVAGYRRKEKPNGITEIEYSCFQVAFALAFIATMGQLLVLY